VDGRHLVEGEASRRCLAVYCVDFEENRDVTKDELEDDWIKVLSNKRGFNAQHRAPLTEAFASGTFRDRLSSLRSDAERHHVPYSASRLNQLLRLSLAAEQGDADSSGN